MLSLPCGVVVVMTASAPGGWLGRALDVQPMRWIGERSYGLYLWHWPVFVYTRPGLDWSLHGPTALAARLAIVALLTELSYRFVEVPLRREGLVSRARKLLARRVAMPRTWRVVAPVLSAVLGVVAVAGATTFVSSRIAHTQARARHSTATLGQGQSPTIGTLASASPTSATPAVSPANTSVAVSEAPATPGPMSELPVVTLPTHPPSRPLRPTSGPHITATKPPTIPVGVPPSVSAVGDSVMLDAATALKTICPGTEVYAVVGWQAKAVFAEVADPACGGASRPRGGHRNRHQRHRQREGVGRHPHRARGPPEGDRRQRPHGPPVGTAEQHDVSGR